MEVALSDLFVSVLHQPDRAIPQLRAEGVTAIEAGHEFFVTNPASVVERHLQLFREAGIRVWSVHAPYKGDHSLSHLDGPTRRRSVEYQKFVLERMALSEASVAVIHPGSHCREEDVSQMMCLLLHSLEELLPVAERLGIQLALENMPPHYLGSDRGGLREVVEKMGSRWLRVCFDTGHAHMAGSVAEWLEELADLIVTFHLADNDTTSDMHLQPPYGTIDWDGFRSSFQVTDFEDPFVVEAKPWRGDGPGQLRREVAALLQGRLLKVNIDGTAANVHCLDCGHVRFGTARDSWCACR